MTMQDGISIFWRIEWHRADILEQPALSTGWGSLDEDMPPTTLTGLSCCRSPRELLEYFGPWVQTVRFMMKQEIGPDDWRFDAFERDWKAVSCRMHRCPEFADCRVIVIEGKCVGTDVDGYPLVLPVMLLAETSWERLCEMESLEDFENPFYLDQMRGDPEYTQYLIDHDPD